jgi:3-phenylpropionate/trans-cinnamate dioxygenase ferredoxin subunit
MEWIKIFSNPAEARTLIHPSKPQLMIVSHKRICLVLIKDQFFAIQDKCSHNGDSLSKGSINFLGEIVCPWHGYRFDLSSGREVGERSRDLITYRIKEDKNGLYIWL